MQWYTKILSFSGVILWMRPANGRRHCIVTSSLTGWAHSQIESRLLKKKIAILYKTSGEASDEKFVAITFPFEYTIKHFLFNTLSVDSVSKWNRSWVLD